MTRAWAIRRPFSRFALAGAVCAALAVPCVAAAQSREGRLFVAGRIGIASQARSCPTCRSSGSSSDGGYVLAADLGARVRDGIAIGVQYGRWSQVDVIQEVDSHSSSFMLFGEVGPRAMSQIRLRLGMGLGRHWGRDDALSAHTRVVGAGIGYVFSPGAISVDTRLDYLGSINGTRDASPALGIAQGPFASRLLQLGIGLRIAQGSRE